MHKRDLFNQTRSISFLWKLNASVVLIFLLIGIGISYLNPDRHSATESLLYAGGYNGELEETVEAFEQDTSGLFSRAVTELLNTSDPFHEKLLRLDELFLFSFEPTEWNPPERDDLGKLQDDEYTVALSTLR